MAVAVPLYVFGSISTVVALDSIWLVRTVDPTRRMSVSMVLASRTRPRMDRSVTGVVTVLANVVPNLRVSVPLAVMSYPSGAVYMCRPMKMLDGASM